MKKVLSIILVAAMLLCMLSACGQTEAPSMTDASAALDEEVYEKSSTVTSIQDDITISALEDNTEENSIEEESTEEDGVISIEVEEVELPLTEEEVTVSFWTSLDPRINDYLPMNNVENALLAYSAIREKTGINIHLDAVSVFNQNEQFSLMCASGDYNDIIYNVNGLYTTGFSGAIRDEVIMDVSELLPKYAPNIYNTIMNNEELEVSLIDADGKIGVLPMVYKETGLEEAGLVYRMDWAEEFGIGEIDDIEEYHEYMVKAKAVYDAASVVASPSMNNVSLINEYLLKAMGGYGSFYQINGNVQYGLVQESYFNYLKKANEFWKEGLIPDNVMSIDQTTAQQGFGVGKYATTICNGAPGISELYAYGADTDGNKTIQVAVLKQITDENTNEWLVTSKNRVMKEAVWSLSSTCSEPELICQLANWFYTEEGSLTCNYGVENVTYIMENGKPQYTDMILNNPDGYSTTITINMYATAYVACVWDQRRTYLDFDEDQLNAIEIFKGADENRNNIPDAATSNFWTADEQSQYVSIKSDLDTYSQEMEYSFVMDKIELTEEAFDTYVDRLYDMGLQSVIDLYQAAYDRYLARLSEL